MIKALIFDFGNVLVRTQTRAFRHKWDDKLGLAHGTAEETVFNSERGRASQHGQHTEEEHWLWVGDHFKLTPAELTQFRLDFWAGDALDGQLISMIDKWRPQYKTAIISNAMDGLRHDLDNKWGIAFAFDEIVVSAEFGTMKPDPSIYHHALERVGVQASEAIFIDDFAHNIEAAEAVGLHGIHYPPTKTRAELLAELERLQIQV